MSIRDTCVLLTAALWAAAPAGAERPKGPGAPAPAEGQVNGAALRLAIEDLSATFGPRYPKGKEYLARLDAIGKAGSPDAGDLAALQREALLANPLLGFQRLLLVRRSERNLGMTPNWGGKTDIPKTGYDNEIVILSPPRPDGTLTTVYRPEKGEFVGDLDLHWNADRLLLSMPAKGGAGEWQVFELRLDAATGVATGVPAQVTPDLPDADNYDACYLPDANGAARRILFSSTAAQNVCPCWGRSASHSAAALYLLDRAGNTVRQLCFDQDHNWCPTVMNDGRVMYLRWEYTDTPHFFTRLLFSMNPDGTGQMALYGRNSYWPNAVFDARAIPGHATRVVGVVGGHHGSSRAGELVLFDVGKGEREADGVIQRIPGRGKLVDPIIRDALVDASWPKFLHPWPLSAHHFLVACKRNAREPWQLCLADVFDNTVPIRAVSGSALLEPIPLVRQPMPRAVPDRVRLDRPDATVAVHDIYSGPGLAGVPRGTVRQIRVFAYHYAYPGTGGHEAVGTDGSWDVKRILGTVPVHEDGSAYFTVPANTPLSLQPLDADGRAVQLMRSWFTAMPGEHVSCTGCHERQTDAPLGRPVAALAGAPENITPWRGPARGFGFAREVQPVLDRHCVGCHDGQDRPGKPPIADLRGGRMVEPTYRDPALGVLHPASCGCGTWHRWPLNRSTSYEVLHRYVRRPGAESDYHLLPPMEYHAGTSELVQMLQKGHHGVQLDAEAWDRLVTWIDLNVPYQGNWGEYVGAKPGAIERRRQYAKRFAGIDEDPEQLPPPPRQPVKPILPPARARPAASEVKVAGWPFDADEAAARQRGAAPAPAPGGAPSTEMKLDLGGGIAMHLVRIPAGEFVMGDPNGCDDKQPASRVRIDRPFWMGKFEVTNEQYSLFDPRHDSRYISVYGKDLTIRGLPVNRPRQPVLRVPWTRATEFCRWLSDRTGRNVSLPTEAQWEWACRAGSAAAMSYGPVDADFGKRANLADKRLVLASAQSFDWLPKVAGVDDGACVTADVGSYAPNAWGLHDMHGNAAEWTSSEYCQLSIVPDVHRGRLTKEVGASEGQSAPTGRSAIDPNGAFRNQQSTILRIIRGGSFQDRPRRACCAFRLAYPPWAGVYNVGFRVVLGEKWGRNGNRNVEMGTLPEWHCRPPKGKPQSAARTGANDSAASCVLFPAEPGSVMSEGLLGR